MTEPTTPDTCPSRKTHFWNPSSHSFEPHSPSTPEYGIEEAREGIIEVIDHYAELMKLAPHQVEDLKADLDRLTTENTTPEALSKAHLLGNDEDGWASGFVDVFGEEATRAFITMRSEGGVCPVCGCGDNTESPCEEWCPLGQLLDENGEPFTKPEESQAEIARLGVYAEIQAERERQDSKWGGSEHDDQESGTNWTDYITRYAAWAGMMWLMGGKGLPKYRRRMMQIAALAVAACESYDRLSEPDPVPCRDRFHGDNPDVTIRVIPFHSQSGVSDKEVTVRGAWCWVPGNQWGECISDGCALWTRYGCGASHNITTHVERLNEAAEKARIEHNEREGKEPF